MSDREGAMATTESSEDRDRERKQGNPIQQARHRALWKNVLLRLTTLYVLPLSLLAVFFSLQYRTLFLENEQVHLRALAEQQAATLDLFLSERSINLSNVIDGSDFPNAPDSAFLAAALDELRQTSDAFIELGVLDGEGRVLAYAGSLPHLETRSYAREDWFLRLRQGASTYIITDIYRGFRDQPHFTIAVKREHDGSYRVLRAVMSPDRIREELVYGARDSLVNSALINEEGIYQVVETNLGEPLAESPFTPPRDPRTGSAEPTSVGGVETFGYAWLNTTPWALIVYPSNPSSSPGSSGRLYRNVLLVALLFLLFGGVAIYLHARSTVARLWEAQRSKEELRGQLVQAAKLASVGELAAGIAHEINNPLAIIAEEVGLLQDLMNPEFGGKLEPEELQEHLGTIHDAAFRGRDITRKLLGFVRQCDVCIDESDIHVVIDDAAQSVLGRDAARSDIEIVRKYHADPAILTTDRNQLAQVLINLIKNADDAMGGKGILTLRTSRDKDWLKISVTDTGSGMSQEQLERIFNPFFTTKDPGKGTGLGLSVSHGIVESLGGKMYVDSKLGVGSSFTVELPPEPG